MESGGQASGPESTRGVTDTSDKLADAPLRETTRVLEGASQGELGSRARIMLIAKMAIGSQQVTFVIVIAAAILAWHLTVVVFDIERFLLPTPVEVASTMLAQWRILLASTLATGREMAAGFGLAAASAVLLAASMHYFRILERILTPLVVAFQTVPKVALAPLFVVWFGFTMLPRVLVAAAIAFFPILVDTMVGLRVANPRAIELVRSMGGSRWQVFRKVEFPSALPSIFGGLKVASTLAVIGAIVGEYIVASEGLGFLQLRAAYTLNSPLVFSTLVLMSALGLFAYQVVSWVERIVVPWRLH